MVTRTHYQPGCVEWKPIVAQVKLSHPTAVLTDALAEADGAQALGGPVLWTLETLRLPPVGLVQAVVAQVAVDASHGDVLAWGAVTCTYSTCKDTFSHVTDGVR